VTAPGGPCLDGPPVATAQHFFLSHKNVPDEVPEEPPLLEDELDEPPDDEVPLLVEPVAPEDELEDVVLPPEVEDVLVPPALDVEVLAVPEEVSPPLELDEVELPELDDVELPPEDELLPDVLSEEEVLGDEVPMLCAV
jgi:hypothetical protein